jgi:hypothetical protein
VIFGHVAAQKFLKQVTYPVSELSTGLTRVMKQISMDVDLNAYQSRAEILRVGQVWGNKLN